LKIADFCGQDTGGQSWNLVQAINEYTSHEAHQFRQARDYLDFPVEFQAPLSGKMLEAASNFLSQVDVVHCHNRYRYTKNFGPINKKAKWVIHQHGRFGQGQFPQVKKDDIARGALRIVSTLNLVKYSDIWFPAPIDPRKFDGLKNRYFNKNRKIIKIAHSPTNRGYKHTELLIEVVRQLKEEGLPIVLILVENRSHAECLRLKADCDITFDQMYLGYGNSGLEGMAFGQATICGCQDKKNLYSFGSIVKKYVGYIPYVPCYPAVLKDILKKLILHPELRQTHGLLGRKYIEEFHSSPVAAKRAIKLYEKVLSA